MKPIEPTLRLSLWRGRVHVHMFGIQPDGMSLDTEGAFQAAKEMGVKTSLLHPTPSSFNAVICAPEDLKKTVASSASDNCLVMREGLDADGTTVPIGSAFYIRSADCPTIIAMAEDGTVIASHGGFKCLIDYRAVVSGSQKTRPYESVVGAMLARFKKRNLPLETIKVYVACGISPWFFKYSYSRNRPDTENERVIRYILKTWGHACIPGAAEKGRIDLKRMIKSQFMLLGGVPARNIELDAIDTCADIYPDRTPIWHSATREFGTASHGGRNVILVLRNR